MKVIPLRSKFVDSLAGVERMGAVGGLIITHPSSVKKILKEYGKEIPSINVMGLIDTGAFSSVITPDVADQLNLVHTGYRSVTSVQDEQEQPVYYGYIQTYWGKGKEIELACCPLKGGIKCLIG